MQPVSPVIPGKQLPESIIAEHQDEYGNLPAVHVENGIIVTRWHLSFWERVKLLITGDIYLWIWTFGHPVQPMSMEIDKPAISSDALPSAESVLT